MNSQYVVKEVEIDMRHKNGLIKQRKVMICFKDHDGILYPHPITHFIDKCYFNKSASLSHQKGPAYLVVQFLNFILEQTKGGNEAFVNLITDGLHGINTEHGNLFLNHLSQQKGLSQDSLKLKMSYLTHFYDFLNRQSILYSPVQIDKTTEGKKAQLISPFTEVHFPKKNIGKLLNKKKDIITHSNHNRVQMVREFLLTAYRTEPSIALGIGFLFFGGLRVGECLNLMKSSVKLQGLSLDGSDGVVLEIRDNQHDLFNHLAYTSNAEVKKPRNQAVLIDKIVPWLYSEHLNLLEKVSKKIEIKNEKALFLNETNGEAISPTVFRKRFERVKDEYLSLLKSTPGRFQDYMDLNESQWSTHIGRGTFTNLVISAGFSVEQTAIARGDSNINSALHYTDAMSTLHNIQHALEKLATPKSILDEIEISELKKSWKEVVHFGKV